MVTKNSLAIPTIIKALHAFIYGLFGLYLPIYLMGKGFSGYHIGIFIGLANLISIISTLPTGLANDRIRSKKIILYALILSIVYYIGLLTLTNAFILGFAFILGGLGRNLFTLSIDSITFRVVDEKRSSIQIGKYLGIVSFLSLIGLFVGGNAINTFGFEATITAIIVLFAITAIGSLFLPITQTFKFKLFEYKRDIFKKEVLFFMFIVFLFSLHYGAEMTSYSLFLKDSFNLDLGTMGLYIASAIVFLAAGEIYFGRKVQKGMDPKHVFYFGLLVSGIGHILFSIQSDVWISFIFRCIHEIGDGAMIFSIFYGIVKIFNIERIGGNSSIVSLTSILGISVGSFIFGPLGEHYGYYLPLLITGGTSVLAFLLLFYFNKKVLQKSA